jgi:putative ABC transport system ATP-binding protein
MTILLDHIIPAPLKDRFSQNDSDIWNKMVEFTQGEYIKIKAPSGTGKTTLVHILYQIRHDYEGRILINNQSVADIRDDALALLRQMQVGIIFQDLRLFPQLTARENIELKRVMQKPIYESSVIHEMAEELGIARILDQKAGLCSYGEQQRIAIIRSLMQPFEWLVMDEPFSHLDIENTQKAAALIARECQERQAGFIITDLDEDSHFPYSRQLHL